MTIVLIGKISITREEHCQLWGEDFEWLFDHVVDLKSKLPQECINLYVLIIYTGFWSHME